jgi:hypothetical protein
MKKNILCLLQLPIICLALLICVVACDEKGSMEKAGKSADRTIKDAGAKVEDATDDAADSIEKAGDDLKKDTSN